ncbi:MAG TPA: FAD-dependent oxidoreductase, partial [Arenibaculum sp.]|nr:FAD-dependent oxidoreductase [Arenibaculum sp.]
QFLEKECGSAPWLKDIHCFNFAATLSLGKVSGDIPEVGTGAEWLATGIASQMFVEDRETHYRYLQAFDTPELLGDEWPEERVTR